MDTPTTLLFDVMGTLVHDPFYDDLPRALALPFEEILRAKHPSAWIDFELGDLTEEEFLPQFFADGRAYDHARLLSTFEEGFRLLPGIEPLLADLNAVGRRPHLFSNYPEWWRRVEARTSLSRFADWTFVSCATRRRKPDPEAYLHALRTLEVGPRDCLFVDDVERNVQTARRLGFDAVRFQDAVQLRGELQRRGLFDARAKDRR